MIAFDRLSQIIPPDQALANKALQVGLQQIAGITNMDLPTLARTVQAVQTNKDLPAINQQAEPISPSTRTYILTNLGLGTGPCGTITIADCLGTAAGYVIEGNMVSTVRTLESMNTSSLQTGYSTMYTCINGGYDIINPMDPLTTIVEIPAGLPGAGQYDTINDAFVGEAASGNITGGPGLIPATQTIINSVVATYPSQTAILNTNFGNISQQIGNEQDLQYRAGLDFSNKFANLQANSQGAIFSFVYSLPSYGLNTEEGGTAQYIQKVAAYHPTTGTLQVGSPVITEVSTYLGLIEYPFTANTTLISGDGIPNDSLIASYSTSGNTITMNQAATKALSNSAMIMGSIGGQAIIGAMRQGASQLALGNAGVLTNTNVPLGTNPSPTQANLLPSTYTVAEATKLLIK